MNPSCAGYRASESERPLAASRWRFIRIQGAKAAVGTILAILFIALVGRPDVTESIAIVIDKNPNPLAAVFDIPAGTEPAVSTRIKMAQTANIYALVRADGKYYVATKEVKVTLGGCGG